MGSVMLLSKRHLMPAISQCDATRLQSISMSIATDGPSTSGGEKQVVSIPVGKKKGQAQMLKNGDKRRSMYGERE